MLRNAGLEAIVEHSPNLYWEYGAVIRCLETPVPPGLASSQKSQIPLGYIHYNSAYAMQQSEQRGKDCAIVQQSAMVRSKSMCLVAFIYLVKSSIHFQPERSCRGPTLLHPSPETEVKLVISPELHLMSRNA